MKLSKRLQAIALLVPPGSVVGDIGTDHGQLPCFLVQQGICPRAVACDVNAQPLAGARRLIAEMQLAEQVETRLGDGLSVLQPGEVETVTISGMGGALMTELLTNSPAVVSALSALVLQPNLAANLLRQWAVEQGWHIAAEELVYEDGRYYEVLGLKPGPGAALSEAELWLGPRLLAERHPLLPAYVQAEWAAEERVLEALQQSQTPEALFKRDRLMQKRCV